MEFHDRIKEARTNAGLSQVAVCEYFKNKGYDVKAYSISNWENGRRSPSVKELAVLCDCYKVSDVAFLLTGKPMRQQTDKVFSGLNRNGKTHAMKYINLLKDDPLFTDEPSVYKARVYRLYDIPVSAGTGEYLDSDNYEEITADDLVPEETDYAVRVSGNSMEPKFYDGQILFIKEQQTLEKGEIGIFALNGEAFVKKFNGNTLVSLNPKYKPIQINDWDDMRIYGKVIGAN